MSGNGTKTEVLSFANHTFTCNLYKQVLHKQAEDNLFFSPFSIYSALSMTLSGAGCETAGQIMKCLSIEENLRSELSTILDSVNSIKTIDIANALFIHNNFEALPSFVEELERSYNSAVRELDFANEPEQAVLSVNDWVNNSTHGKITKLLDNVESNTVLIILNAVYFKSFWAQTFNVKNTAEQDFYLNENETVKIKLMYQSGKFRLAYNEIADCIVLELPYKDKVTSMLVFLPREMEGLRQIEEVFDANFLKHILENLGPSSNVDVYLPTFKMEQSISLKTALSEMGMTDIFIAGKADLKGISKDPRVYVSDVVHKSFIHVNEEGTEAAAVTGVMAVSYCASFNQIFRADHPFMFCIIENTSKQVLFIGCLKNPSNI